MEYYYPIARRLQHSFKVPGYLLMLPDQMYTSYGNQIAQRYVIKEQSKVFHSLLLTHQFEISRIQRTIIEQALTSFSWEFV